jgi:hypothetical protein
VGPPLELAQELIGGTYETKTRGERYQPSARPAGQGRYALIRHERHTHLSYRLHLPKEPGEVQRTLRIASAASYVIAVFNPFPRGQGEEWHFPDALQARFGERRFSSVDPPSLLDYPGTEVALIGRRSDVQDEPGLESLEETADLFTRRFWPRTIQSSRC